MVPPPFAGPSSIKIIVSSIYPGKFLKFHHYVLTLTALKVHIKTKMVVMFKMVVMSRSTWRLPPPALSIFIELRGPQKQQQEWDCKYES